MKDIKSLYLTAKTSGNKTDISAYTEAINEFLESDPNGYISNLEYIIKSSIGLKSLGTFVEKYGLPISYFDNVMERLEECVKSAERLRKDTTPYKEAMNSLIDFRSKYAGCFMMESYINSDLPSNYIQTYYSFNENGVQNRKLIAGLIDKYGEAAIPDIIITADSLGNDATSTALKYIESLDFSSNSTLCELILEAVKPFDIDITRVAPKLESGSLSTIISNMKARNNEIYKEAVIFGNDDACYEYTEQEVSAISDMISYLEYKLTWCDELHESVDDCQKSIYSLYEEADGIKSISEDVADNVIPMITPDAKVENKHGEYKSEGKWLVNTKNKKTGEIPTYLGRNHDLAYGEDDPSQPSSSTHETEYHEPELDDFKRPSADELSNPSNYSSPEKDEEETDNPVKDDKPNNATNNYYYYTYNNSLNKNSHSFNKDYSHNDDHSTNKGDNRTDNRNYSRNINQSKSANKSDDAQTESSDTEGELEVSFKEAVGDADDNKPESDHPIKDTLMDIDKKTTVLQQKAKKKVQDVQNVGRAFMKPVNRTKQWLTNMVYNWKDADETNIKEKMADPHARNNLFSAIRKAITAGSLFKAGILLNPLFLFLSVTRGIGKNKREFRIRNEMIGELKTELSIIDEKIKDADRVGDNQAKYKLMRLKNEINKKLLRVGGNKNWKKFI